MSRFLPSSRGILTFMVRTISCQFFPPPSLDRDDSDLELGEGSDVPFSQFQTTPPFFLSLFWGGGRAFGSGQGFVLPFSPSVGLALDLFF